MSANYPSERNYDVYLGNETLRPIYSWTRGVLFEHSAKTQLRQLASLPFLHKHIAVMPDVHAGIGSTVGSVIATKGAVIPAAVGVDIGCGMIAAKTSLTAADLPDNLKDLRSFIEKKVPHGRTANGGPGDRGAWHDLPPSVKSTIADTNLDIGFAKIVEKHPKILKGNLWNHLGTLGTGNHFIEICLDETDSVWVMLHSGSRGVGGRIGSYFIDKAKREMERWYVSLPNKDLAYLPEGSVLYDDYLLAVSWAQKFAMINRDVMMRATLGALEAAVKPFTILGDAVNCHHNYVSMEHHFGANVLVTRKGAVRARTTDLGIIPGSMGTRSYIVRGKGNPDSFHSCSHGAGRKMSRTEAKKTFTLEEFAKAMEGVESRRDIDVIDEAPMAYKDIDEVMAAQADLVDIVHTLKAIVCVKG